MFRHGYAFALLLLAGGVAICSGAQAQVALSEREAQGLLERHYSASPCDVRIPVGEHHFVMVEAAPGGPRNAFVKHIKNLESIGVVRIVNLKAMLGYARFRVDLNDGIDKHQLFKWRNLTCMHTLKKRPPVLELVKIDAVKGGRTEWTGAIVYYTYKPVWTDLYLRLLKQMKYPSKDMLKVRSLFRYDPFEKNWRYTAGDVAATNGSFTTSYVSEQLKRD